MHNLWGFVKSQEVERVGAGFVTWGGLLTAPSTYTTLASLYMLSKKAQVYWFPFSAPFLSLSFKIRVKKCSKHTHTHTHTQSLSSFAFFVLLTGTLAYWLIGFRPCSAALAWVS